MKDLNSLFNRWLVVGAIGASGIQAHATSLVKPQEGDVSGDATEQPERPGVAEELASIRRSLAQVLKDSGVESPKGGDVAQWGNYWNNWNNWSDWNKPWYNFTNWGNW